MGLLNASQTEYYHDNSNWGKYQFTSLDDIITYFQIAYVGEGKLISKVRRSDVAFHAQRAMQELSFDTLKSCKAIEIEIPASLTMTLPQDYVNYTKLTWSDSAGIEHIIYPTSKTSNPIAISQDSEEVIFDEIIKNGDFENSLSHWTSTNNSTAAGGGAGFTWNDDATLDFSTAGEAMTNNGFVEANAGPYVRIYQTSDKILAGHTYRVSYDLTLEQGKVKAILLASDSTDIERVYRSGFPQGTVGSYTVTQDIKVNGTSIADWSQNWFDDGLNIIIRSDDIGGVNFVGTIDNVSCYDLGVHSPASQIESDTWSNYKSGTPSENQDDYQDGTYWPAGGERYGLDPQHAQANGSFYMDCNTGKIHFSSNMSGKTVILKYISDGLGTDEEMIVHKFAEEAMYKWIAYGILSTRINTPEYIINRFKKEKFAETRKAKLRLSNIKLEEITQILRGKSKQIKH